jgi:hypothetical protein
LDLCTRLNRIPVRFESFKSFPLKFAILARTLAPFDAGSAAGIDDSARF